MLRLGGYINILIAIGHIVGLIWSEQMFEVTGIGKEMNELAQTHPSLPYLLTVFVAIVFLSSDFMDYQQMENSKNYLS